MTDGVFKSHKNEGLGVSGMSSGGPSILEYMKGYPFTEGKSPDLDERMGRGNDA